jgi:predicted RNA-binding Zn-ribbon protein involved in translation (DUF1610 family)
MKGKGGNVNAHDEFRQLALTIIRANQKEDWKCPSCGTAVSISFEVFRERKTSLTVRCSKCLSRIDLDDDVPIPAWYKQNTLTK